MWINGYDDYRALLDYGHSPNTASQIIRSARHGDAHSIEWLNNVRKNNRHYQMMLAEEDKKLDIHEALRDLGAHKL